MSASKQKGTGGEREVVRRYEAAGFRAKRTEPGFPYDINVQWPTKVGLSTVFGEPRMAVLATRPDRGQWLATLPLDDLIELQRLAGLRGGARVEVKRYRRFAHHTIFEETFS